MKKNILKVVFASAFVFVAGYSVYSSQQKAGVSKLAMENIEALAYPVEDGNGNVMYNCDPVSGTCAYELGVPLPGRKS